MEGNKSNLINGNKIAFSRFAARGEKLVPVRSALSAKFAQDGLS